MNTDKEKLLFVYNADATLFAAMGDFTKRVLAPEKYQCNLCAVTHGIFNNMKGEWKKFLGSIPHEKESLHRDEFKKAFPAYEDVPLPAIFLMRENDLYILATSDEINEQKDTADMIGFLKGKLKNL